MTGTLHEYRCTFMIVSRLVLRIMINVSAQRCRERQNTHFMLDNFFFWKSCPLWHNVEKHARGHRWQYGARNLRAGQLKQQTHTQTMYYLLIFHGNDGYANAPQCYVIRKLPVLEYSFFFSLKGKKSYKHMSDYQFLKENNGPCRYETGTQWQSRIIFSCHWLVCNKVR